jgi:hypothetical protein
MEYPDTSNAVDGILKNTECLRCHKDGRTLRNKGLNKVQDVIIIMMS